MKTTLSFSILILLISCAGTISEKVDKRYSFYSTEKAKLKNKQLSFSSVDALFNYNTSEGLIGINHLIRNSLDPNSYCFPVLELLSVSHFQRIDSIHESDLICNTINLNVYKYIEQLHDVWNTKYLDSVQIVTDEDPTAQRIALLGIISAETNALFGIDSISNSTVSQFGMNEKNDSLVKCLLEFNGLVRNKDWRGMMRVGDQCRIIASDELDLISTLKKRYGDNLYRNDFVNQTLESELNIYNYLINDSNYYEITRIDSIEISSRNASTVEILRHAYSERLLKKIKEDMMFYTASCCTRRRSEVNELEELE